MEAELLTFDDQIVVGSVVCSTASNNSLKLCFWQITWFSFFTQPAHAHTYTHTHTQASCSLPVFVTNFPKSMNLAWRCQSLLGSSTAVNTFFSLPPYNFQSSESRNYWLYLILAITACCLHEQLTSIVPWRTRSREDCRIIAYAKLEGTHNDHWVQLLAFPNIQAG